ncbi:MAG: uracil-DNA glycosylase [Armatimonadota bacterium]
MEKSHRMAQLKADAEWLQAEICEPDAKLVWGDGNLDSALAIVGEAPAAEEDRLGRPFVGRAGKFLDRELLRAGIQRDRIYITNTVKCRDLTTIAINSWLKILLKELEIVRPKMVLCFGSVAASALIHTRFAMSKERGTWFDGPFGSRVMATFHPSYVSRFGYRRDSLVQEQFRRDLEAVAAELSKI